MLRIKFMVRHRAYNSSSREKSRFQNSGRLAGAKIQFARRKRFATMEL
jgi:hypothetical protein